MAEALERYCGNCGHELSPEDQFCPNCGKPVHRTARVPTPEADVPVPPPPQPGGTGAAASEQPAQDSGEPVTKPFTWRLFALVFLAAGFGTVIILELALRIIVLPWLSTLSLSVIGLIGQAVLYLANALFGFLVGYFGPSRNLKVYGALGLAVGVGVWVGDIVWVAFYKPLIPSVIVYGFAPALIFSSIAILGALTRKGQLSLNTAVITSVIGFVSAIAGLIAAIAD
jgi:hypothetical protein